MLACVRAAAGGVQPVTQAHAMQLLALALFILSATVVPGNRRRLCDDS